MSPPLSTKFACKDFVKVARVASDKIKIPMRSMVCKVRRLSPLPFFQNRIQFAS